MQHRGGGGGGRGYGWEGGEGGGLRIRLGALSVGHNLTVEHPVNVLFFFFNLGCVFSSLPVNVQNPTVVCVFLALFR